MTEELRILFVDDSPEDVELQQRELRHGGLSFVSKRVEQRDDLAMALRDLKPDLVISDYSMPALDGLTALKVTREICPEVPFIFVSGTIGEERAIESLKSGATDYVVKDRIAGLVVRVRRALKEVMDREQRRMLEEQFRQAQKMEAVGRLAGGVAHDFNNLLTVIMGYTENILARFPPGDPMQEDLREVLNAGQRAASLTRQLLAFSRKQVTTPTVINLNSAVAEMDKMLRRLIGEDIELNTTLDSSLGRVKADATQIEQVIVNLAVNARDAMPDGGKLTIETANVTLDEALAPGQPGSKPGPHVMLSVTDTGHGMDAETRAHLFEPFFTTKEQGKGTGLGLSTVYGIVQQCGGTIVVHSEPGLGAAFKLYLPCVDAAVEPAMAAAPAVGAASGTETILVAEDSEGVRKLLSEVLRKRGYNVLAAGDGEEALLIVENYQGAIHLLITDVIMPRVGGKELAERIAPIRPETRVLYTSGYADPAFLAGILEPGVAYLQKPYPLEDLVRTVKDVLSAEKSRPTE